MVKRERTLKVKMNFIITVEGCVKTKNLTDRAAIHFLKNAIRRDSKKVYFPTVTGAASLNEKGDYSDKRYGYEIVAYEYKHKKIKEAKE